MKTRTETGFSATAFRAAGLALRAAVSLLLLTALGAAAAIIPPTPTPAPLPGACVLGAGNCTAIIAAGSRPPQMGDPGITLGSGGTGALVFTVPGAGLVGGGPNQPATFNLDPPTGGMWTSATRIHPVQSQTVSVLAADGFLHATQFNLSIGQAGRKTGAMGVAGAAGTGTATMFPANTAGYSTGMTLQGTMSNGSPWPVASVSFALSDPRGVGHYEYIGIDYGAMLSILAAARSQGTPIGQVWIPLAPSGGSGNPTVIKIDPNLGPGGTFYTSVALAPAVGYGDALAVPTLSSWGIACLTLALAAAGFLHLRKTGFQLGL